MSRVFVDTSAVFALLSSDDGSHESARSVFQQLQAREAVLVTTSFVLVEVYALLARRMGLRAVRRFREEFAPLLDVVWVDRHVLEGGLDLLVASDSRRLSLVDAVSFLVMRDQKLDQAFAFDRHFEVQGFEVLG